MRLLALFLLFPLFISAQDDVPAFEFPNKWLGEWMGNLEIYSSQGLAKTIPMKLYIAETDEPDRWQWMIIYESEEKDLRQYELREIDYKTGHFVIDEKNSILLDAYWLGNTLCSRFSVNNSLLLVNYTFEEDHIRFEIFAGDKSRTNKTGEEVKEIDSILAYPVSTAQRAILRKKE